MGNKKNLPIFENVKIESVSSDGRGIARINDIVTFVPWCVPEDIVSIQITKKKSSYMEGSIIQLITPSSHRVKPICRHFGTCGGCKWQMLDYQQQLLYKKQQVVDAMERIAKLNHPNILPIIGSQDIYHYRNKLEFACSYKQWLTQEQMQMNLPFSQGIGFHITGCFDKVLDIEECFLMADLQNQIRNSIRQYALDNNLTFYNEHTHQGLLRNIIVRCNNQNEWMLTIVFGEKDENQIHLHTLPAAGEKMLQHIQTMFPKITSLQYCINTKMNDTIGDLPVYVWYGKDSIEEQLDNLKFKVGPKSFYQTNTQQVIKLYQVVQDFALTNIELSYKPIIYDLYTGTGTIALFISKYAKRVIGIEYVKEAVDDAKDNASYNKITNAAFVSGDMKDILNDDFINQYGTPDIIITDPPRSGMHPDVIKTLMKIRCKRIVYVSCNPATQARDLNLLNELYEVVKMQPVDMFPHTQHVENVALLQIK